MAYFIAEEKQLVSKPGEIYYKGRNARIITEEIRKYISILKGPKGPKVTFIDMVRICNFIYPNQNNGPALGSNRKHMNYIILKKNYVNNKRLVFRDYLLYMYNNDYYRRTM